jgi:predicted glycosyltransferase
MKEKGHYVYITVKDIPAAKELLKLYSIRYIDYGSKSDSLIGKTFKQLKYDWNIKNIVNELDIDIGIGTSITISHVSKITKMISFILDDDDSDVEPLFAKFAHPFADYLISPDVLKYERPKKNHLLYPGYHELSYLHPNRFSPDKSVLRKLGLEQGDKYFILRFNAFKAHHDIGAKGLSNANKNQLISLLNQFGKVIITTEGEINPEYQKYKFVLSPTEIFSALHYATLFIGDSQTMTNEAAVLGTPALRLNSFVGRISYLKEQEDKYNLAFGYKPNEFNKLLAKVKDLLSMVNIKQEWNSRRQRMLSDKIDVTSFLVNIIDKYPESLKDIKNDTDYFRKFK